MVAQQAVCSIESGYRLTPIQIKRFVSHIVFGTSDHCVTAIPAMKLNVVSNDICRSNEDEVHVVSARRLLCIYSKICC